MCCGRGEIQNGVMAKAKLKKNLAKSEAWRGGERRKWYRNELAA